MERKEYMNITESQVLLAIEKVLMENRKVLKLNNGQQQPPMGGEQMPPMDASAAMPPMSNDSNAGIPPMDANGGIPPVDSEQGEENQFDTNFDAGVEADEETDPKKYIQQLTGKLSQSLNSFNSEQGEDAGLCKYVAAMIIKATCKFLDDKAKKELIEKINSAASDETDDENMDEPEEDPMGDNEMPQDDMEQEQPMMEMFTTKKDIKKMLEQINSASSPVEKRIDTKQEEQKSFKKSPFIPKKFNK